MTIEEFREIEKLLADLGFNSSANLSGTLDRGIVVYSDGSGNTNHFMSLLGDEIVFKSLVGIGDINYEGTSPDELKRLLKVKVMEWRLAK